MAHRFFRKEKPDTLRDRPPARRGMRPAASDHATNEHTWYKESTESEPRPGNQIRDLEKADEPPPLSDYYNRRASLAPKKDDPFGDEEGAEVKYRTLRWW
ncbi:uncharacterized protein N0V89_009648 [Didymosphaeria variabile]|uniref:Uncharacterized protein n=1 Tax=Didymosphaeria variabile TaxID=1932322 RepID=A0A9W8XFH2_9PLEO|nr:uncharacterized protein N0V89_009648 [Didymosphaeria variabile]KAJ4348276.1 hypothetical protein N0V89_009648 [Didymosphaeria variabile]